MSLALRVGDQDFTNIASNIQTKNIAEGGFASVTFNVKRKLEQSLFDEFTDVVVFDSATAEQVGGGRLLEQGRNDDGSWQVTALGEGLASMQDITTPVFYVDQDAGQFRTQTRNTKRMQGSAGNYPNQSDEDTTLVLDTTENITMAISAEAIMVNRLPDLCNMNLGGLGFRHKSGIVSTNWRIRGRAYNSDLSLFTTTIDDDWQTTISGRRVMTVQGDFSDKTVASISWKRIGTTRLTTEDDWSVARDIIIRSQIYGTSGALRTAGYLNEYILPHEVIIDWVVRYCPRLDVLAGDISTVSTQQIEQMTYIDGVHGMQLAEDVRAIEPALTWQVWEQGANGRWPFYYLPLSTVVQYEASTDDGFSAPSPSSEIYNKVTVTGTLGNGRDSSVTRTRVVPALDNAGIVREATIPLGSEVWSVAAANKVGDEFLAEHSVVPNAGTITIARPIYDNLSGRWIKPCNIRAGGLMRVRGIQPTPDTLNATSPDGVTVFRVVSATFDNDSNSCVCELDSYALTESRAIAKLARARKRRGA